MAIQRVGVVGFGQMGSGIAQVCAQAGIDTLVREVEQPLIQKGFQRVDSSLARLVKSQRVSEDEARAARGRIRGTVSLADFGDRELVIEAIVEEIGPRKKLFAEIDTTCSQATTSRSAWCIRWSRSSSSTTPAWTSITTSPTCSSTSSRIPAWRRRPCFGG